MKLPHGDANDRIIPSSAACNVMKQIICCTGNEEMSARINRYLDIVNLRTVRSCG